MYRMIVDRFMHVEGFRKRGNERDHIIVRPGRDKIKLWLNVRANEIDVE